MSPSPTQKPSRWTRKSANGGGNAPELHVHTLTMTLHASACTVLWLDGSTELSTAVVSSATSRCLRPFPPRRFFSRSPLHKTKSQLAHRFSMGSSWQSRSAFAQPTRVCPVLHTSTSVTDGGSTFNRKCLAATQMFQTAASVVPRALNNVLPPPVHVSWHHIRFWSRRCELELLRAASKRSMSIGQLGRSRHPPSVSRRTCPQL